MRLMLAACVALGAASSGCDLLYTFDRELPVSRGAIFGEAVRDDVGGEKAAYSQINMMGVGLVRQASDTGAFVLTDLNAGTYILRINDDDDGDGQPERSRLVSASLVVADRPDALGFGSGSQLVSTSLGEVVIQGTGTVSGEVTVDDGNGVQVPPVDVNLGGRALIFRDIVTELTGEQALQLGADAETHVDAAGRYQFNETLSGDFLLVVALHQGVGAVRNETVFVSEPQRLTLNIGESVTAASIEVAAVDANLEQDVRPVEVLVNPPLVERSEPYAIFVPPGRAVSTCQTPRPTQTQFDYERIVSATASSISRIDGAPLGVWDVRFCGEAQFVNPETGALEDEATLGSATLYSLVIPPSEDGLSTVLTGPVVLTRELDPCLRRVCTDGAAECPNDAKDLIRDCDGDGIVGIAPYDPTDQAVINIWSTCAVRCGATTGLAAVEAECVVDDVTYDCDDDGDLQSDASEPPACYGPGLGDDRDGDGVCSGADGFPTCTTNTAATCDAGTVDVTPVIPEEFSGGEVGGVFDLAWQNGLYESFVTPGLEFRVVAGFAADADANLVITQKIQGQAFDEGRVSVDAVQENGNIAGLRFLVFGNQLYINSARTNPQTSTTALVGARGIDVAEVPIVCRLDATLVEDISFGTDGCENVPLSLDGVTLPVGGWKVVANDAAAGGDVFVASEATDTDGANVVVVEHVGSNGLPGGPPFLIESAEFGPDTDVVVTGVTFIPLGVGPERIMVIGTVTSTDQPRAFYVLMNLLDRDSVVRFFPVDDTQVAGALGATADFLVPDDSGALLIGGTVVTDTSSILTLRRIDPQTAEFFTIAPQTRALVSFGGGPSGSQAITDVKVVGTEVLVSGFAEGESERTGFLRRFAAGNFDVGPAFDGGDIRLTFNSSAFDQVIVGNGRTHVAGRQFDGVSTSGYWIGQMSDFGSDSPNPGE